MRRLWLDYQRTDPARRRLGLGLLSLGLLASGVLLGQYLTVGGELDAAREQVAKLRLEVAPPSASPPSAAASAAEGRPAAAGEPGPVARTSADWEALFAALEVAGDESVTLLGLQPGSSEIQITGEAKNLAASMDYVKRLQTATVFANTHLTQSDVVMEHPQHPIRFTLVAEWRRA